MTSQTLTPEPRVDALHQLGTDVTKASNAQQALAAAGLAGWNVRKTPLMTEASITVGDEEMPFKLDVPGKFATVRTNPATGLPEVLGVVGNIYKPIQNEAHCAILDTIVDYSGANFESAGQMRGGRDVFVSMKLNDQVLIGGVDPIDMYLASFNSHDGSSSFKLAPTAVRVFCANQQAAIMKGAESSFTVRHTVNARSIVEEARHALDLTFAYSTEFQAAAERLIDQTMTDAQFADIIGAWWPLADEAKPAVKTRHAKREDTLMRLFADAETNANIRGTRWAAYQTITEYVDHFAPTNLNGESSIAAARATRVLTGATAQDVKNFAFQSLLAKS